MTVAQRTTGTERELYRRVADSLSQMGDTITGIAEAAKNGDSPDLRGAPRLQSRLTAVRRPVATFLRARPDLPEISRSRLDELSRNLDRLSTAIEAATDGEVLSYAHRGAGWDISRMMQGFTRFFERTLGTDRAALGL
jgi:hypothetical protein